MSYDILGITSYQLHLIQYRIAFWSSRINRFVINSGNQVGRFATGNICINRVGIWPREQPPKIIEDHRTTTKGHRNLPLADLVQQGLKVSHAKDQTSIVKTVACSQEKLSRGGIHPSPPSSRCGRTRVKSLLSHSVLDFSQLAKNKLIRAAMG